MKKIIFVWSVLALSSFTLSLYSQAYDGEFDRRLILTNSFHFNGAMGVEMGFEWGLSEYISLGLLGGFTYKHGPITYPPHDENDLQGFTIEDIYDEEEIHATEGGYAALMVNFHYGELVGLPDNLDIYSGVNVIKNAGVQTGIRFQVAEFVGLMAEINIPLKKRLFTSPSRWNFIEDYERPFVQVGFAFGI